METEVDPKTAQDSIDRSDHIAIVVGVNQSSFGQKQDLERDFVIAIEELAEEFFSATLRGPFVAQTYPIGPAAGVDTHFIITILDHKEDIIFYTDILIRSIGLIRQLYRKIQRDETHGAPSYVMSYTPVEIEKLCEDHIAKAYHPRARLKTAIENVTDSMFSGYVTPAHPSELMRYIITVSCYAGSYIFHVNGAGKVSEFFLKRGRSLVRLDPPDLLA